MKGYTHIIGLSVNGMLSVLHKTLVKAPLITLQLRNKMSGCCPAKAWGDLKNPNYKEKGTVEKVDDLEIYHVGSGSKCIIWNYDIFGFQGGRTRQMCDFMADAGYLVIMPDYYRGEMCDPSKEGDRVVKFLQDKTKWSELQVDWEKRVKPLAEKLGAKTYGTVGCCWGSYMVMRLCAQVCFKAGISFHPSHSPIIGMINENEEEILKDVKSPQMFMPAQGDHPNLWPDGLGKKVMGDQLSIVPFPDMQHGWTIRGGLDDPKVQRDVEKAFNLSLTFFNRYL